MLVNKYLDPQAYIEESCCRMVDLDALSETLKVWILELPGVTQSPHRFGGTEFQVHGLEFMHCHGPSFLDIRLSQKDQARVLKEGKAQHHRAAQHHQEGWVSFRIEKADDLEGAKKLIQLAYENAKRTMDAHRSKRTQSNLA